MYKLLFQYTRFIPFSLLIPAFFLGLVIGLGYLTQTLALAGAKRVAGDPPLPHPVVGNHTVGEWTGARNFQQAPVLQTRVAKGELPDVEQRLPENPLVIHPPEQLGPYGGNWTRFSTGPGDIGAMVGVTHEGLIRFDPLLEGIIPNMATSWEILDDAKTYVFHLRRGVRWSDGQHFTSADVRFWYEGVLKNRELSPVSPNILIHGGKLMELDTPDPYTVIFRFPAPHPLFLRWLAREGAVMLRYPAHYMRQFHPDYTDNMELNARVARAGFDFWYQYFQDRTEWRNIDLPTLGAWVIQDPPPARRVLYTRNPYYWKVDTAGNQLPYLDEMSFQISSRETINLNFMRGEMGVQHRHVQLRNYPLLMEHRASGGYRINSWLAEAGTGVLMLNLNHRDPQMRQLMGDIRFRHALSIAINRHEISEVLYYGLGVPSQIGPARVSPYYCSVRAGLHTQYDPHQAGILLDQLGLTKRDARGMRILPDGRPLKLTIELFDLIGDIATLQLVVDYWRAVGVDAEVRQLGRSLFYTRMPARLHDIAVGGNSAMLDPALNQDYFIPFTPGARHALDYVNWFRSDGERGTRPPEAMLEVMRLYRALEIEPDDARRDKLIEGILSINAEQLWIIGLLDGLPSLVLVNNDFRNVPDFAVNFASLPLTAPECYSIDAR